MVFEPHYNGVLRLKDDQIDVELYLCYITQCRILFSFKQFIILLNVSLDYTYSVFYLQTISFISSFYIFISSFYILCYENLQSFNLFITLINLFIFNIYEPNSFIKFKIRSIQKMSQQPEKSSQRQIKKITRTGGRQLLHSSINSNSSLNRTIEDLKIFNSKQKQFLKNQQSMQKAPKKEKCNPTLIIHKIVGLLNKHKLKAFYQIKLTKLTKQKISLIIPYINSILSRIQTRKKQQTFYKLKKPLEKFNKYKYFCKVLYFIYKRKEQQNQKYVINQVKQYSLERKICYFQEIKYKLRQSLTKGSHNYKSLQSLTKIITPEITKDQLLSPKSTLKQVQFEKLLQAIQLNLNQQRDFQLARTNTLNLLKKYGKQQRFKQRLKTYEILNIVLGQLQLNQTFLKQQKTILTKITSLIDPNHLSVSITNIKGLKKQLLIAKTKQTSKQTNSLKKSLNESINESQQELSFQNLQRVTDLLIQILIKVGENKSQEQNVNESIKQSSIINRKITLLQENQRIIQQFTQLFNKDNQILMKQFESIKKSRRKTQFPFTFLTKVHQNLLNQKKNANQLNLTLRNLSSLTLKKNLTQQNMVEQKNKIIQKLVNNQIYKTIEDNLNLLISNSIQRQKVSLELQTKKLRSQTQKLLKSFQLQKSKCLSLTQQLKQQKLQSKTKLHVSSQPTQQSLLLKTYEKRIRQLETQQKIFQKSSLDNQLLNQTVRNVLKKMQQNDYTWRKDVDVLRKGRNYLKYQRLFQITKVFQQLIKDNILTIDPQSQLINHDNTNILMTLNMSQDTTLIKQTQQQQQYNFVAQINYIIGKVLSQQHSYQQIRSVDFSALSDPIYSNLLILIQGYFKIHEHLQSKQSQMGLLKQSLVQLQINLHQVHLQHKQTLQSYHHLQQQSSHRAPITAQSIPRSSRSVHSLRQSNSSQKNNKLQELRNQYNFIIQEFSNQQKKMLARIKQLEGERDNVIQSKGIIQYQLRYKDKIILTKDQNIQQKDKLINQYKRKYQYQLEQIKQLYQNTKQNMTRDITHKNQQIQYFKSAYQVLLKKYQQQTASRTNSLNQSITNINRSFIINEKDNKICQLNTVIQKIEQQKLLRQVEFQKYQQTNKSLEQQKLELQRKIKQYQILNVNRHINQMQIKQNLTQIQIQASSPIKVQTNILKMSFQSPSPQQINQLLSQIQSLRSQLTKLTQQQPTIITNQVLMALKHQQQQFNQFLNQNNLRLSQHYQHVIIPERLARFQNQYNKNPTSSTFTDVTSLNEKNMEISQQILAAKYQEWKTTYLPVILQLKQKQWINHYEQHQLSIIINRKYQEWQNTSLLSIIKQDKNKWILDQLFQQRLTQLNNQQKQQQTITEFDIKKKLINQLNIKQQLYITQFNNKQKQLITEFNIHLQKQRAEWQLILNQQISALQATKQRELNLKIQQVQRYWQLTILPQKHEQWLALNRSQTPLTSTPLQYSQLDLDRILSQQFKKWQSHLSHEIQSLNLHWSTQILPIKLQQHQHTYKLTHTQQSKDLSNIQQIINAKYQQWKFTYLKEYLRVERQKWRQQFVNYQLNQIINKKYQQWQSIMLLNIIKQSQNQWIIDQILQQKYIQWENTKEKSFTEYQNKIHNQRTQFQFQKQLQFTQYSNKKNLQFAQFQRKKILQFTQLQNRKNQQFALKINQIQSHWQNVIIPQKRVQWQTIYKLKLAQKPATNLIDQIHKVQQTLRISYETQLHTKISQIQNHWQLTFQKQQQIYNKNLQQSLLLRTEQVQSHYQNKVIPHVRLEWQRNYKPIEQVHFDFQQEQNRIQTIYNQKLQDYKTLQLPLILQKQKLNWRTQFIKSKDFQSFIHQKYLLWQSDNQLKFTLRINSLINQQKNKYQLQITNQRNQYQLQRAKYQLQLDQYQLQRDQYQLQINNQRNKYQQQFANKKFDNQNADKLEIQRLTLRIKQYQDKIKQSQKKYNQIQSRYSQLQSRYRQVQKSKQQSLSSKQAIYKLESEYQRQLHQLKLKYQQQISLLSHQKQLLSLKLHENQSLLIKPRASSTSNLQSQYQKQFYSLQCSLKTKQSQITFLKKTLESSHLQTEQFQKKIFMLLQKIGGLESVLQQIRNSNAKLQFEIKYWKDKEQTWNKKLQAKQHDQRQTKTRYQLEKTTLEKKIRELTTVTQNISTLQIKCSQLQSQLSIKSTLIKTLQSQVQKRKLSLQQQRTKRIIAVREFEVLKSSLKHSQQLLLQHSHQSRKSHQQIMHLKSIIQSYEQKQRLYQRRSQPQSTRNNQFQEIIRENQRLRMDHFRFKQKINQLQAIETKQIIQLKQCIHNLENRQKHMLAQIRVRQGDATEIQVLKRINHQISQLVSSNKQLQLRIIVLENQKQLTAFGISIQRFFVSFQQQMQNLINYLTSNQIFLAQSTSLYKKFQQKSMQSLSHGYIQDYFRQWQSLMRGLIQQNLPSNNPQQNDNADQLIEKYDLILTDVKETLKEYLRTGDQDCLVIMTRSLGIYQQKEGDQGKGGQMRLEQL